MTFEQVQREMESIKERTAALAALGIRLLPIPPDDAPEVVWSGGELLPPRDQSPDERLSLMPSIDDDEPIRKQPTKQYNMTGRYAQQEVTIVLPFRIPEVSK